MKASRFGFFTILKLHIQLFVSLFGISAHAYEFTVPLRFDVVGKSVELAPLKLKYDFETSGGNTLKMGSFEFDEKTFKVLLFRNNLFLFFPGRTFNDGSLEMLSKRGQVIWSTNISKFKLRDWDRVKKEVAGRQQRDRANIWLESKFGLFNVSRTQPLLISQKEDFKFCFSEENNLGKMRACTPLYQMDRTKEGLQYFRKINVPVPPRVIVNNEDKTNQGELIVKPGDGVQFYGETSLGALFEFYAVAPEFKLLDMVDIGKGRGAYVLDGSQPILDFEDISVGRVNPFFDYLGWIDTIGDLRSLYRATFSLEESQISIRSVDAGGVFVQELKLKDLPTESMRVYIDRYTPKVTYVDDAKIFLRPPEGYQVLTQENEIKDLQSADRAYRWYAATKNRGEVNKARVTLEKQNQKLSSPPKAVAFYEMYKGFPRELSIRYVSVAGSNNNYSAYEGAFAYWFENVAGLNSYYFSRLRWGISYKYFKSIDQMKLNVPTTVFASGTTRATAIYENYDTFTNENLDLKYRFVPGLWGRDESMGIILSYLRSEYAIFTPRMLGGGFFWAKSMPKTFDKIFNIIPFLRYPKWVDFEVIYFAVPLQDEYRIRNLLGNFALNFHGKVLWTKRFFGEAGFGVKSFSYDYTFPRQNILGSERTGIGFSTTQVYANLGIGFNF